MLRTIVVKRHTYDETGRVLARSEDITLELQDENPDDLHSAYYCETEESRKAREFPHDLYEIWLPKVN